VMTDETGGRREAPSTSPILELRKVSKSFGAVQVLYDVDFHVAPGEVMALVGDNGAGKSTLIKCIAGIHPIDGGEIVFEDKKVTIHGPKDSADLGIEVVYQDLALADNLDVVQNMYIGREEVSSLLRLDETAMEKRASETLKGLSVTTIKSVRQTVAGLSGGQRQSVAVAKAVMWNSRVVILDEPTAALGIEVVYQDLALADNLDIVQNMFLGRERGKAWALDEASMEQAARETLATLSVRTVKSVRTPVSALSGGQRQTVAIAKAVLWNSKVVLLDEPTAALGVAQTRQVLDLVRRLAEQGLGVVLISHNMADVMEVSDRIATLYLGRLVADLPRRDLTHSQVVELITAGRAGELGLARPDTVTI
ncbi:MAG: D-xylose transport system ATP-binding protein, partial [Pseudonocardiales bacterium]|nr:D-xylose transport system ATP-binding protein [Pseudonocardiales bacterium]